jgi:hypothetical protein
MNWAAAFAAVLFAVAALSMIAPAVVRDPFATAAAFLTGVFVGMLLENAMSDRCSEGDRRRREKG